MLTTNCCRQGLRLTAMWWWEGGRLPAMLNLTVGRDDNVFVLLRRPNNSNVTEAVYRDDAGRRGDTDAVRQHGRGRRRFQVARTPRA